jgi:hypothetical protein
MALRVYVVAGIISAVTAAGVSWAVLRLGSPTGPGENTPLAPQPAPRPEADRKADQQYARQVCLGFLTALRSFDPDTVRAFCTPDYRKQVTGPVAYKDSTWEIETEAMAADGREASFQGIHHSMKGRSRFAVLVVRQPHGGQERWLVDAFTVVDVDK